MAFVEEEAALLARRESARLREIGAGILELPSWRKRRKTVRVHPSGNVYSVLTRVSLASMSRDAALLGRVEVSQAGVDGWWNRFTSDFEIAPGARPAQRAWSGDQDSVGQAFRSRLRETVDAWPRSARILVGASVVLAATGLVSLPLTTEFDDSGGACSSTVVTTPVAFVAIALAYLALAGTPMILWRRGLAGSPTARLTVLFVTLWIGLLAVLLPIWGAFSLIYLLLSAVAVVPALIAGYIGTRDQPTAAPGLMRSATVLALIYFGLVYLAGPHPVVSC